MSEQNDRSSQVNKSNQGEKFYKTLYYFGEFIEGLQEPNIKTNRGNLSEILTVGIGILLRRYYEDEEFCKNAEHLAEALRTFLNEIIDNGLDQVNYPISFEGECSLLEEMKPQLALSKEDLKQAFCKAFAMDPADLDWLLEFQERMKSTHDLTEDLPGHLENLETLEDMFRDSQDKNPEDKKILKTIESLRKDLELTAEYMESLR